MRRSVAAAIKTARTSVGYSQRDIARLTGISQSTLSRIDSGERSAKLPELVLLAEATGVTVGWLTGQSRAADRVNFAARATNGADMAQMRAMLLSYVELNEHLEDMAVPRPR